MTLLYLRKHHGDEMPFFFLFFLFFFGTLERRNEAELDPKLKNDKLCQLLLVMPNYDSNV